MPESPIELSPGFRKLAPRPPAQERTKGQTAKERWLANHPTTPGPVRPTALPAQPRRAIGIRSSIRDTLNEPSQAPSREFQERLREVSSFEQDIPEPSRLEASARAGQGIFGSIISGIDKTLNLLEIPGTSFRGDRVGVKTIGRPIMSALDWFDRNVSTPTVSLIKAGAVDTFTLGMIETEGKKRARQLQLDNPEMSFWEAHSKARRSEWEDASGWGKAVMFAEDLILDPLTYVAGPGKLLSKAPIANKLAKAKPASIAASHLEATPDTVKMFGFHPLQQGPRGFELIEGWTRRVRNQTPLDNAELTARRATRQHLNNLQNAKSRNVAFAARTTSAINSAFDIDKVGRVATLKGIVKAIPGAPTIQDVAARYPEYTARLSPTQRRAMDTLRDDMDQYKRVLDEYGVEIETFRKDIIPGGFYVPRGKVVAGVGDMPVIGRGLLTRGTGEKGYLKAAKMPSMTKGIDVGYEYDDLTSILFNYGEDVAKDVSHLHLQQTLLGLKNEMGDAIAFTAKQLAMERHPRLMKQMEKLRASSRRIQQRIPRQMAGIDKLIQEALDTPLKMDFGPVMKALRTASARRGLTLVEKQVLQKQIKAIQGSYNQAIKEAVKITDGRGVIDLPPLRAHTFPDEIASAVNKILEADRRLMGTGADVIGLAKTLNTLNRSIRATADFSALGIHGLLYGFNHPVGFARAAKLHFQAFGPNGKNILGKAIGDHDLKAIKDGVHTSQQWADRGLQIGGEATEYTIGQGATRRLAGLPGIKQANRAFGFFGDIVRIQWADDMLRAEVKRGRVMKEIIESGDDLKIASIANNMTGFSGGKAFGSVGDLLFFAPRFLQARLESTMKATMGLRAGATLDQRIARNSMLKMIGVGTALTFGVNEWLGNETDTRFILKTKDGKSFKNPNYMKIRFAERDISLFGPWDSLLGAISSTATGDPKGALRALSSGIVSISWDLISGQDFIGENVREDEGQFTKYILQSSMPFAFEELPAAFGQIGKGEVVAGSSLIIAELLGVKSSPLSLGDTRDIEAWQLRGLRYDQLKTAGDRNAVNDSPNVQLKQADRPSELGPVSERANASFENSKRTKLELEDTAIQTLEIPTLTPRSARQAVQQLKHDGWITGQALFGDPEVQEFLFRDPASIQDAIAGLYWSADAGETDEGIPNYALLDSMREDALRLADQLGIDRNYILGEGPGTFRRTRFDDPALLAIVQQYEADRDTARPYWRVSDEVLGQFPPEMQDAFKIYERASADIREQMRRRNRYLTIMDRRVREAKDRLFTTDQGVQAALVRWGYRQTPSARPRRQGIRSSIR